MPFGWGIVGTGKHPDIKIAPAMAAADGGELVGVYSRDQHRAEAFAQKHDARAAYSQLGDLLKDSRVDGVFVSSPNALHAEHVVQAAEAGKHVLCEKPMATTIADAVRMLQACRRAGVTLGIAFNLRQHPAYIRARELVAAGTLGRIVLAQAQWAFGVRGRDGSPPRTPLTQWWDTPELIGGASTMMGTGVHSVDLLRFVLGAEVDEITAVTDGQTVARPLEQLACLTLRFGNGTLGQVVASRLLPDSRNDFRVYGITGLIAGHHSMWEARTGRFEITSDTVNETADYPEALLPNYVAERGTSRSSATVGLSALSRRLRASARKKGGPAFHRPSSFAGYGFFTASLHDAPQTSARLRRGSVVSRQLTFPFPSAFGSRYLKRQSSRCPMSGFCEIVASKIAPLLLSMMFPLQPFGAWAEPAQDRTLFASPVGCQSSLPAGTI